MPTFSFTNDLGLPPPPRAQQVVDPPPANSATVTPTTPAPTSGSSSIQTEFMFELPKGYLDAAGNLHRKGVMRLAKAVDEVAPMRDPRVRSNPAYATIIILSRVILRLGALDEVTPIIVEDLFACDLNYLQNFYRQINDLMETHSQT